jgi:hypothetical protein
MGRAVQGDATVLRWFAWSGVAALVILLIGQWGIADFVPPPSPHNTLAQTIHVYVAHRERIRIGLIVATIGVTFLGPWCVALTVIVRRMEGPLAPLSWLQIMFGALLVFEFLVPFMMWQAAAFRPTDHPEITYRLHDLASITYDGLPTTAAFQAIALGVAILRDRHETPLLPRWLAYLSFWAAIGFMPGILNPLVHAGPFAWNGLIAWWLGLVIFGVWMGALTIEMLRSAIPALAREVNGEVAAAG